MKRLYRSEHDRKISGVCGGLAEYFQIDPTIVRIIFLFLIIPTAFFVMPLAYLVGVFVIPTEKEVR